MTETSKAGRPRRPVRTGRARTRPTPTIDAAGREDLGHALRRAYAELLAAPIPERFTALLAGLGGGEARTACDDPEERCP